LTVIVTVNVQLVRETAAEVAAATRTVLLNAALDVRRR
jgi:hypothetical protein